MSGTIETTNSAETPPTSLVTTPASEVVVEGAVVEAEATPPVESEEGKTLLTEKTEGEETTAAEFVPLTTEDLVLPEGFTTDEELQTEFLAVVNDQELSAKDRANALLGLQAKLMTKASEAGSQAWDDMQTKWRDEVKSDPVIGGDKMRSSLDSVSKLILEYGSKELSEVFDVTGAGNNVHVIKFLHSLAGKLTEGGPTFGQPSNAPTDAASLLYPSMKG